MVPGWAAGELIPSELYHQGKYENSSPINRMVTPGGPSLGLLKLINSIILAALWAHRALGDMLNSIVPNSHFGKRLGAQD